jgi:hypothetical protein
MRSNKSISVSWLSFTSLAAWKPKKLVEWRPHEEIKDAHFEDDSDAGKYRFCRW